MRIDEAIAEVHRLFTAYGDRPTTKEQVAVYAEFLLPYERDAVRAAITALIATSQSPFLPTIARILEECEAGGEGDDAGFYTSPENAAQEIAISFQKHTYIPNAYTRRFYRENFGRSRLREKAFDFRHVAGVYRAWVERDKLERFEKRRTGELEAEKRPALTQEEYREMEARI